MKKVLWTVAVVFVIGIFFWYGSGGIKTYAARINGTRIEIREFQSEYSRRIARERKEREKSITDEDAMQIRQHTLASLINQEILLQEAKRMGIRVSEDEIINAIRNLPQFQHEEQFNMEIYKQTLQFNLGMSPEDFEEMIKHSIIVQKLEQAIISSATVSEPELKLYYKSEYGSLDNFQERGVELRQEFLENKRTSLYRYWLENLRGEANIDINPDVIQPPERERKQEREPTQFF